MLEPYNIELTIKSASTSDAENESLPSITYEKFSLYARYSFDLGNETHTEFVFIAFLFQAEQTLETGETKINILTDINTITKASIDSIIKDDMKIRIRKYSGDTAVSSLLNKLLHNENLGYHIDIEKEYTAL